MRCWAVQTYAYGTEHESILHVSSSTFEAFRDDLGDVQEIWALHVDEAHHYVSGRTGRAELTDWGCTFSGRRIRAKAMAARELRGQEKVRGREGRNIGCEHEFF